MFSDYEENGFWKGETKETNFELLKRCRQDEKSFDAKDQRTVDVVIENDVYSACKSGFFNKNK